MKIVKKTHTVPHGIEKSRLDKYVLDAFDIFHTRKSVRKAIKRGEIRVNEEISEPFKRIEPGEKLQVIYMPENKPKAFKLPLRIIYEDDWLAIIEKPPGYPVNGNKYKTIENALQYNLEDSPLPDALKWPRPVHRLDSNTGGLLLVAKTSGAQVDLGRQFQERTIQKRYRAIVIGKLENYGTIKENLDGRETITHFSAVQHIPSLRNKCLTLLDLWPVTGRQHQIRRHLLNLGFPVLGDKIYGKEGTILTGKGLFLWAVEISFLHPGMKWIIKSQVKEADKFQSMLAREERRWKKYN